MCEQQRLWRVCAFVQARISLHCSTILHVPKSNMLEPCQLNLAILESYNISVIFLLFGLNEIIWENEDFSSFAKLSLSLSIYVASTNT